jgi:hypothetical protein
MQGNDTRLRTIQNRAAMLAGTLEQLGTGAFTRRDRGLR